MQRYRKRALLFNPYTTRTSWQSARCSLRASAPTAARRFAAIDVPRRLAERSWARRQGAAGLRRPARARRRRSLRPSALARFRTTCRRRRRRAASSIDDGAFQPRPDSPATPSCESQPASNALLVSAKRSKTGHPMLVGGPQVGYFFPQFFMEVDLHGGGLRRPWRAAARDCRSSSSAAAPTSPGRSRRRRPTTSTSSPRRSAADDDRHYLHQGSCREMTTPRCGNPAIDRHARPAAELLQTVHGVVQGYATVGGRRVALSRNSDPRGAARS